MRTLKLDTEKQDIQKIQKPTNDSKKYLILLVYIFPVLLAFAARNYYKNAFYWETPHNFTVGSRAAKMFSRFDLDDDNYLSIEEFQAAFYAILNQETSSQQREPIKDVTDMLKDQIINDDEETILLEAIMKPLEKNSMKKFADESLDLPGTLFNLNGLLSWKKPHLAAGNFSVMQLTSVFLPQRMEVGAIWDLIPRKMAKHGKHLESYRYYPPRPTTDAGFLFHYLLNMFHPLPFIKMRFPPTGAVASVRAISEYHVEVVFRLINSVNCQFYQGSTVTNEIGGLNPSILSLLRIHPEFQLNTKPQYPFWFTPAAFIGKIVMRKDGTHIESFKMYVPTTQKLNVDMEWLVGINEEKEKDPLLDEDVYDSEVDIGFIEKMEIFSTFPSSTPHKFDKSRRPSFVQWDYEMDNKALLKNLEKEFYPFKEVPYFPFNETFEKAKKEQKLIHHILLWGSLDDQSC